MAKHRKAIDDYPKIMRPQPSNQGPKRRKKEAAYQPPGPRYMVIELTQRYSRNGHFYGPGSVRVKEALALDLLHAEDAVREQALRYYNPVDRLVEIVYGPNGNHVRVKRVANVDIAMQDIMQGHAAHGYEQNGRIG